MAIEYAEKHLIYNASRQEIMSCRDARVRESRSYLESSALSSLSFSSRRCFCWRARAVSSTRFWYSRTSFSIRSIISGFWNQLSMLSSPSEFTPLYICMKRYLMSEVRHCSMRPSCQNRSTAKRMVLATVHPMLRYHCHVSLAMWCTTSRTGGFSAKASSFPVS